MKQFRYPALALAGALTLSLTLAACGKKEEAPPEEDIPAQGDDSALPDNTPEETPEEEEYTDEGMEEAAD